MTNYLILVSDKSLFVKKNLTKMLSTFHCTVTETENALVIWRLDSQKGLSAKIFKIELDIDSYRFWGKESEKNFIFLKCLELVEKLYQKLCL
jgi:hypothetical protein